MQISARDTMSIIFENRQITANGWSYPRTANPMVSSIFVVFAQMGVQPVSWTLSCFILLSLMLASPSSSMPSTFQNCHFPDLETKSSKFGIWFVVGFAVLPFSLSALNSLCVQSPFTVCPLIIASSTLPPHHSQPLIIATTLAP